MGIQALNVKLMLVANTLLVTLLLTSCDTPVQINSVVYNNSDYDLKLFSSNSNEEISIPKKSNKTIFVFRDYARKVYQSYDRCGYSSDSIIVLNNPGLSLTKSLEENNNWSYEVLEKRKGQCSIVITNDDIN